MVNFESPVCEWHATLVHDVFRDILLSLPDNHEHRAADQFRTLALATLGTWTEFVNSNWMHFIDNLDFGVGEIMRRFVAARR